MIRGVPRLADRAALVDALRRAASTSRKRAHPRRGPLRPAQDQAAHPRVSRGAQAEARGQEPDPVLRRTARASARPRSANRSPGPWAASSCRISLGGVHDEAEIRGHRRTYYRGASRAAHPVVCARPSTRNPVFMLEARWTSWAQLPRRPVGGPLGAARPRAELDLPRPLSRGAVRPVAGDVHRHGERARPDPGPRCATAWR